MDDCPPNCETGSLGQAGAMTYEVDRLCFELEKSRLVVSRGDCGRDAESRDSPPCVEPPLTRSPFTPFQACTGLRTEGTELSYSPLSTRPKPLRGPRHSLTASSARLFLSRGEALRRRAYSFSAARVSSRMTSKPTKGLQARHTSRPSTPALIELPALPPPTSFRRSVGGKSSLSRTGLR